MLASWSKFTFEKIGIDFNRSGVTLTEPSAAVDTPVCLSHIWL